VSSGKLLVVRLLFLSPFPSRPLYGGAVVRNHYLAQALTERHQVWASFCGLDGGEQFAGEVPLRREGLSALFDPLFLRRAYATIKQEGIEAIVSSSLISGLHGALLKLVTGLPFWMDEHNVEWHCSRRYGHRFWWLIYLLERFILRQADYITCVSLEDKERLLQSFRLDEGKISVAPNGVDYPRLSKRRVDGGELRTHKRILFFGVLDYPPNREAVEYLGTHIVPNLPPEVEVVVAGCGGEHLESLFPQIRFRGFVDDIHALIKDCDGLVVPILAGGGTRMKILETVACGRPVVSTTCGAEGIDLRALGNAITITDEPAAMVEWVEKLAIHSEVTLPSSFPELYDWATIWHNKAPL
jgi:glycosyltransferase involved in cell wall biosynthesis